MLSTLHAIRGQKAACRLREQITRSCCHVEASSLQQCGILGALLDTEAQSKSCFLADVLVMWGLWVTCRQLASHRVNATRTHPPPPISLVKCMGGFYASTFFGWRAGNLRPGNEVTDTDKRRATTFTQHAWTVNTNYTWGISSTISHHSQINYSSTTKTQRPHSRTLNLLAAKCDPYNSHV